jgi:hypothetical protein
MSWNDDGYESFYNIRADNENGNLAVVQGGSDGRAIVTSGTNAKAAGMIQAVAGYHTHGITVKQPVVHL